MTPHMVDGVDVFDMPDELDLGLDPLVPREYRAGFSHESPVNESMEWYTPPEVFDALGVHFDLDPCSPGAGKSFVPADRHLTVV